MAWFYIYTYGMDINLCIQCMSKRRQIIKLTDLIKFRKTVFGITYFTVKYLVHTFLKYSFQFILSCTIIPSDLKNIADHSIR